MQRVVRAPYDIRPVLINATKTRRDMPVPVISHENRVWNELKSAGLSAFALQSAECRYLINLIHPDEHIGGAVYGRVQGNLALLVATNCRVLFIDKRPLSFNEDEVTYDVVSGMSVSRSGFGATLTLNTRVRDYTVRTFSLESVERFMSYIESNFLEKSSKV